MVFAAKSVCDFGDSQVVANVKAERVAVGEKHAKRVFFAGFFAKMAKFPVPDLWKFKG